MEMQEKMNKVGLQLQGARVGLKINAKKTKTSKEWGWRSDVKKQQVWSFKWTASLTIVVGLLLEEIVNAVKMQV